MSGRIGLHLVCLLAIYQLLRVLFWWANAPQFPAAGDAAAVASLLLQGLRFDVAALALINAPVYILYGFPLPRRWWVWQSRSAATLAVLLNAPFLAMNLVDIEYYKFTGKRLTRDSFAIAHDIGQQLGQIVAYYWYYSLLMILLGVGLIYLSRSLLLSGSKKPSSPAMVWLLFLPFLGLAARGGWQNKPLIPAHALASEGGQYAILVLNSSFTFLKSSDKTGVQSVDLLPLAEMKAVLRPDVSAATLAFAKPRNVVLVIMESFGREYVLPTEDQASFTPFFHSLMQRGTHYEWSFANGRRSIDALPSILASIPAWMETPFITSPYQTNRILGLPDLLARTGMQTHFYHGGHNGTMFFDVMARQLGFQRYIGAQEYPDPADYDGQWGIFDEPFLQHVVRDLSEHQDQPFFATVFTLTSHHPYRIPDAYKGRFPKGTLEIHESLGYADYALQRFYEEAKKQPWFADTLFILTADHTSKTASPLYETPYGRFAVPLIFIQNDQALPWPQQTGPVQHLDVMPTLLDLFGLDPQQRSPFGQSLLRPLTRPGVVLYDAGIHHLVGSDELLSWNIQAPPQLFSWRRDPLLRTVQAVDAAQLKFLKASIQSYNNGMVYNQLIW